MQPEHADVLMGNPTGLLADAPATLIMAKQQAASAGGVAPMAGVQRQQQQQQPPRQKQQQRQQPPGTPAFSWDSVGEALQGFGEGADDSLAWDDLADFDLPDLKQHEVDELLNF
jgi:hypothetical protein